MKLPAGPILNAVDQSDEGVERPARILVTRKYFRKYTNNIVILPGPLPNPVA